MTDDFTLPLWRRMWARVEDAVVWCAGRYPTWLMRVDDFFADIETGYRRCRGLHALWCCAGPIYGDESSECCCGLDGSARGHGGR